MSDNLLDMKTINTRELQKRTRDVRRRLMAGEALEWVMGKRVVGYLRPASEHKLPEPWPDLQARLDALYGEREEKAEPAAETIYGDRG